MNNLRDSTIIIKSVLHLRDLILIILNSSVIFLTQKLFDTIKMAFVPFYTVRIQFSKEFLLIDISLMNIITTC